LFGIFGCLGYYCKKSKEMKTIKTSVLLLCTLAAFIIIANGCGKEGSTATGTTTVAEDKAFINDISATTNNCIKAARDGNLSQSIIQFFNLSNGTAGNENWVDSMSNALETVMGVLELDPNNSKFNYSAYWGTYNWNRTTKTFSKTAATGIFINIPSDPAQTTNNVSFKFTEYTDGLYQANAKAIYLPKTAKASIVKNNVIIADLNFSGNYSSGSFPRPINVSYQLLLAPHTYNMSITEINSTKFKLTSDLFSGQGCGMSISATVTFKNDDYNNLAIEDDLSLLEAEYKSGDMTIKSNWDAKAYYAISNPTTTTLNASLSNSVYNKTDKIADLKFLDVAGERKLFIYYKDGTSENTSVYYDPFLTNFKNTLRPLFGVDVDSWF
jgi:hypothetical protein